MPRISRVVLPDHLHHVTQRGVRSQVIFFEDADRDLYLRLMREQCDRFGVRVLCYCLMSNHVHLLALPSTPSGLARGVGEAHRRYTLHINKRMTVRGYLFQGRFSSCPMDGDHALAAARYVLLNPVRAGVVERAADWRWSSAAFHVGMRKSDALVERNDLLGHCPNVRAWRQLIESNEDEHLDRVRRATRTGRPLGGQGFDQEVELATGRQIQQKAPGRPKRKK